MEKLRSRLTEVYGNRRWVIAAQAAVAATGIHEQLTGWDSETLIIASNAGTGELPDTSIEYTGSGGLTILDSIREFYDSVVDPDPEVLDAVDRFDPERSARVITEPHATAPFMLSRRTFGVRKPEWSAWEDKMRVDSLWEKLGIDHAPYLIVDIDDAPAAAEELATESGTVWVADNTGGWHGGGELVRWARDRDQYGDLSQWFRARSTRVRIMPFLEGLPCSIHGWVTATGIATFLPVEILILRHGDGPGFEYAGVATVWQAPEAATASMRRSARLVGERLREADGYLGPFGIDGVLTVDGFRPTELNPRMSAGAGIQLGDVDLPLGLLMRAEIEGLVEVDHRWLEESALGGREPTLHFGKMVTEIVRDTIWVGYGSAGELVTTPEQNLALGKIEAGPSATGSYIMGDFDTAKLPDGISVGPIVADAMNLASDTWNLSLPRLVAAPSLVS